MAIISPFIFSINIIIVFLIIISGSHIAASSQPPEARVATDRIIRPKAGVSRRLKQQPYDPNSDPIEGDKCNKGKKSNCNGIEINNGGTQKLFYCCKGKCSDVLADRNSCGSCNNRCGFGQECCGGRCAAVAYDVQNCGGCGNVCRQGIRCEYGSCGYA